MPFALLCGTGLLLTKEVSERRSQAGVGEEVRDAMPPVLCVNESVNESV